MLGGWVYLAIVVRACALGVVGSRRQCLGASAAGDRAGGAAARGDPGDGDAEPAAGPLAAGADRRSRGAGADDGRFLGGGGAQPNPVLAALPAPGTLGMGDPSGQQTGADWPVYGGTTSARRYSPLAQINAPMSASSSAPG
jgi:hypothetical protein